MRTTTPSADSAPLLGTAEVARILGRSAGNVRKLVTRGLLEPVDTNAAGGHLFSAAAVEQARLTLHGHDAPAPSEPDAAQLPEGYVEAVVDERVAVCVGGTTHVGAHLLPGEIYVVREALADWLERTGRGGHLVDEDEAPFR